MAAPTWNDAVSIVAVAKVAAGATTRGTLNVQNLFGGYLYIRAMRLSASGPSVGITISVRRLLKGTPAGGTGGVDITHSQFLASFQDGTPSRNLTTLNGSRTIPGATVTLTTATGFAGGQFCGIVDSTTTPTIIEFGRTSKLVSTTLTFDRNLTNTALATGHTITNNAILVPPVWVDGTPNTGDIEVIFDLGLEATTAYAVECWAQTLSAIA